MGRSVVGVFSYRLQEVLQGSLVSVFRILVEVEAALQVGLIGLRVDPRDTGKASYTVSRFTDLDRRFRTDDLRSRWQAKLGVRFNF